MADDIDLEKLASEYVDLWQNYLDRAKEDENTSELMSQTMGLMNAGAATFANAMAQAAKSSQNTVDQESELQSQNGQSAAPTTKPQTADRTAPASVSPELSAHDLNHVLERLALLEKRVAQLEQAEPGQRTSKVRSRRRSEAPDKPG